MNRLADVIVPFGLRIACRRASWPTSRSPCSVNATTDGVVRDPSALGMTVGSPPSSTAITELVVPRSMPTALAMPSLHSVRLALLSQPTPRGTTLAAAKPSQRRLPAEPVVAAHKQALAERLAERAWRGDETIVDVGAGDGALLEALLRRRPGLRGIAFDLPQVASEAVMRINAAGLGAGGDPPRDPDPRVPAAGREGPRAVRPL